MYGLAVVCVIVVGVAVETVWATVGVYPPVVPPGDPPVVPPGVPPPIVDAPLWSGNLLITPVSVGIFVSGCKAALVAESS